MRIGLVSDTHIPDHVRGLPKELFDALAGVDLILHGGDIYELSVLDSLQSIAPVIAARGDDDFGATVQDPRVKHQHILQVEGQVIWLIHQRPYVPLSSTWNPPWWENKVTVEQNGYGKPNIVVFGHEHRTFLQTMDEVIFVSPGSPTFLHYQQGLGTYGIIDIDSSGKPNVQVSKLTA